jgi:hypothetical protein
MMLVWATEKVFIKLINFTMSKLITRIQDALKFGYKLKVSITVVSLGQGDSDHSTTTIQTSRIVSR